MLVRTTEKWQKNVQEKQMLVIVDDHIEWDKTKRSGIHFSNILRTIILGIIILSHALNFIRMIYLKYLSGLYLGEKCILHFRKLWLPF